MKKRRILTIGVILAFSWMMVACNSIPVEINVEETEVTLTEGDTYDLDISTSDEQGFIIDVASPSILSVDETGRITALNEGVTTITIRSVSDENIAVIITVTVERRITLTVDQTSIVLKEGEEQSLTYASNGAVNFVSSDPLIFTVDATGKITAIKEGTATLTVRSMIDTSIEKTVSIEVRLSIYLTVLTEETMLWIDENLLLDVESNADVSFTSSDTGVATVDSQGNVVAIAPGTVTITIQSLYDENITESHSITVYSLTTEIVIESDPKMNIGTTLSLKAYVYPNTAYQNVQWISSDPSIASIDALGNLTAHTLGSVSITATSLSDESKVASVDITIIDTYLVTTSTDTEPKKTYQGVTYNDGVKLFKSISEALAVAGAQSTIYVLPGTYNQPLVIHQEGIRLIAESGAIITSLVQITANHVRVEQFIFEGEARIVTEQIEGLIFTLNTVRNTDQSSHECFMTLTDVGQTEIMFNQFDKMKDVILVNGVKGSLSILENNFDEVDKAIVIHANPHESLTPMIRVFRNQLQDVHQAFEIMPFQPTVDKLDAIVRFNVVENYEIAAKSDTGIQVDFTLNYWGSPTPDDADFIGIDLFMRRGFYATQTSIPKESDIKPDVPLAIEITSSFGDIVIGETHTITYSFLPMEFSTTRIRFLTSDPVVLGVTQTGVLTPLRSGTATITVRSSIDTSVNATITIIVTTTPGIEFASTEIMSDVRIGDTFNLNATPFPISFGSESIIYESSNPLIASINSSGNVTAHSTGLVTLTASMENHPDVINTMTIFVYATLDTNNVLDLLSTYQVMHTPSHTWTAFGQSFNYIDKRYQSVSRYYFGDIEINTSKIVPVSTGIRPGEGFSPHPEGITQYNPYNVYWIVLHDTANTSPGAGALAHANYLWNLYATGQQPFVSWHFTIDSQIVYQHLPEIERGFHAGDGSVLPGQSSTYFGGGNRNGIGIEMAINQDGDMFRTWQRTAKLVADLLVRYNLPLSQMAYHVNFSGKDCPRTLRNAGLIPLFEEFAANEYQMRLNHPDAVITFESDDPDILDNHGRIIKMPDRGQTVSYTITVTDQGITSSRTFYTYVPGTVK